MRVRYGAGGVGSKQVDRNETKNPRLVKRAHRAGNIPLVLPPVGACARGSKSARALLSDLILKRTSTLRVCRIDTIVETARERENTPIACTD